MNSGNAAAFQTRVNPSLPSAAQRRCERRPEAAEASRTPRLRPRAAPRARSHPEAYLLLACACPSDSRSRLLSHQLATAPAPRAPALRVRRALAFPARPSGSDGRREIARGSSSFLTLRLVTPNSVARKRQNEAPSLNEHKKVLNIRPGVKVMQCSELQCAGATSISRDRECCHGNCHSPPRLPPLGTSVPPIVCRSGSLRVPVAF